VGSHPQADAGDDVLKLTAALGEVDRARFKVGLTHPIGLGLGSQQQSGDVSCVQLM